VRRKYPKRIKIVPVLSSNVTLEMWQRSEELVAEAMRLAQDRAFKLMLDCLRNSSPVNYGLPDVGTNPMDRAALQAKTEGYHMALNNIEAMSQLLQRQDRIEAVFENPDEQTNKE
jgi:hypothetical protein